MRTIVNRILGRRLINAESSKKRASPEKETGTQVPEKQKLPGQLPLPFTEK